MVGYNVTVNVRGRSGTQLAFRAASLDDAMECITQHQAMDAEIRSSGYDSPEVYRIDRVEYTPKGWDKV